MTPGRYFLSIFAPYFFESSPLGERRRKNKEVTMLKKFKTYQLAIEFHRECKKIRVPTYLRDQLLRASSSVVLNIAEGSGKATAADQRRFYSIALGSLRESTAILEIVRESNSKSEELGDQLGACLYRLCHPKPRAVDT